MQERSAIVVGALVVLLVLFPLGFLVHVAPRFPGSLAGSLIGISAAILMLVPLIYVAGKRIPVVHRYFAPRIESRTLLSVHIYAGVLAPILGLIHAAHKFDSPMGISLTGIMLVLVISGYVGRYMLIQIGRGLRGRAQELAQLRAALAGAGMAHLMSETSDAPRNIVQRLLLTSAYPGTRGALDSEATIASALADVEYAVRSENVVNSLFGRWRKVHIVLTTILYFLLVLHIWSGVYYGLRWI